MTFQTPDKLPPATNQTGPPTPPSGFHTPIDTSGVFAPTGGLDVHHVPPAGAGANIHGEPQPPSGHHTPLGRAAALLGRLLGRG
jgi:hypothetical protein